MTKNNYTGFELSKKIFNAGYRLKSDCVWTKTADLNQPELKKRSELEFQGADTYYDELDDRFESNYYCIKIPAYDILNDICVKYAKEFFGEEKLCDLAYGYHSIEVLNLLQQNKKEEAEKYIWENCLFHKNHKNDN